MNLAEILGLKTWNPQPPPAETADSAETAQPRDSEIPQTPAENCGKEPAAHGIRRNPQSPEESETRTITGVQAKSANPHNPQTLPGVTEQALPVTREHFNSQGVYLLADDLAYLRWHLPTGTSARNAAVREYVRRWHEAMEGEPVEYRKDNAGRRAANTWLRSQYHLRGANRADRKVEL
ncbi:hypothetical protein [Parahaliea aestuarii]|uniref:Uncharacterized protein n=1 Tax=Parahaliea aestuarii TaxID=1852021 RepID=A0A5C9A477_9GAMM|nr:hypothetical protein [Parahaliea aestuarii]TXS94752.1 hypothetical protein FVW59_02235 [Parahaliea aestuarii]